MTDVDAKRFEMHSSLKEALGDTVANTLMEHLPYGGSSRVATKDDIADLSGEVGRVDRKLNWCITIGVTVALALMAMQVQIMFSIANLSAALNK